MRLSLRQAGFGQQQAPWGCATTGGGGNHIYVLPPLSILPCSTVAAYLESLGFKVTYLPVDSAGYIDLGELQRLVGEQTALVTLFPCQ